MKSRAWVKIVSVGIAFGLTLAAGPKPALAQPDALPRHLRDREAGIPTSMLGTYVQSRQLLVFPFYEHVSDRNQEYNPAIFGFGGEGLFAEPGRA